MMKAHQRLSMGFARKADLSDDDLKKQGGLVNPQQAQKPLKPSKKLDLGITQKFNPNHDHDGRFAAAADAVSEVEKGLKATETTEGHHASDVRDSSGRHVGLVYNAGIDKPAWVGYHVTEGTMTHEVDDSNNPHANLHEQHPTKDVTTYRGSKEEALHDIATMEAAHQNRMKQYAEDDAKSK